MFTLIWLSLIGWSVSEDRFEEIGQAFEHTGFVLGICAPAFLIGGGLSLLYVTFRQRRIAKHRRTRNPESTHKTSEI